MPISYHLTRRSPSDSNCRSIVTAFSIVVCIRIWITSSIALAQTDQLYGHWLKTEGVIVGYVDEFADDNGAHMFDNSTMVIDGNSTNTTTSDTDMSNNNTRPSRIPTYCALLNYTTDWNEQVTSISDYPSDCSISPSGIPMGMTFEIRYNPDNPKEFIRQMFFADEIMSLSLMIAIGFVLTVILFFFICKPKPEHHRHHQHSFDGFGSGDDEELGQIPESPEERKERILSKMVFQTVREDLSNITAEQVRILAAESAAEETAEESNIEEQQQGDQATNDPHKKMKPLPEGNILVESQGALEVKKNNGDRSEKQGEENQDDEKSTNSRSTTSSQADNTHDENHQSNGLLQMFSSYWNPQGEAECCICLDKYEAGDTICASKNPECGHVYHKDCVMDWLMKNHNQCPLCRIDLLK